jgi:hypothetical protein
MGGLPLPLDRDWQGVGFGPPFCEIVSRVNCFHVL